MKNQQKFNISQVSKLKSDNIHIKCRIAIGGQQRNFYTDFTAVFILRVNIRVLVGYIGYWMLHLNAILYRGLKCFKKQYSI